MILLSFITFQNGDFFFENSNNSLWITIIIPAFATIIAFFAVRYQLLSMSKKQLAEKAKECNKNVDYETLIVIQTTQNISNIVSIIINTEQLISSVKKKNWLFAISKEPLIQEFYLQLHTSIINYIINFEKPNIDNNQVKYQIDLQLEYCKKLFNKSIKKYGNATPKEINDKLEIYKDKYKKEGLIIIEAIYRSINGDINITDKINDLVKDNKLTVTPSKDIEETPNPDKKKVLKIKYQFGSKPKQEVEIAINDKTTIYDTSFSKK